MKAHRILPLCLFFVGFSMAQNTAEPQKKIEPVGGIDCVRQRRRAARWSSEEANRRCAASDVPIARNAVDATLLNVHRAVECSLQARKGEKKAEIELRTLSRRMKAIAQTLDSEERPYLSHALTEVESERDRLLHVLFGDAAGTRVEKKP